MSRQRTLKSIRHDWDVSSARARQIQNELRGHVIVEHQEIRPTRVAGVDVGFEDNGRTTRAAVAVLRFPQLELVAHAIASCATSFPYIPGLLSFREVPAVLAALEKLDDLPDVLLCDGHGVAHPRRFGIACHLGVLTGLASVGVAKKRLIGSHGPEPVGRGQWTALTDGDETIGAVLRTRMGVKPIYVSVGHRIGLENAVELVMACVTRYRLPETTRNAHRLASGL